MSKPYLPLATIAQHNKESDLWIIVDGKAYDCTEWQKSHPGGAMAIQNFGGKDCTETFNRIHSKTAKAQLADFHVANVAPEGGVTMDEVARHTAANDLWTVIDGNVYDVTRWQDLHPGGKGSITGNAGKDASKVFASMHQAGAIDKMAEYLVGPVKKPPITMEEVSKHTAETDMWTVIDGLVYDVTKWQDLHPGGKGSIKSNGGKDASKPFHSMHEDKAIEKMKPYLLGPVAAAGGEEETQKKGDGAKTNKYRLLSSEAISHNTKRLYFVAEPGEKFSADGLQPGGHMVLNFDHGAQKGVARNYTPVVHKPGQFELVVKCYEGGKGSQLLHQLEPESGIATFEGPIDSLFDYRGARDAVPNAAGIKTLVLVAGGTGVAPMYSIAEAALKEKPFAGRVLFMGCFQSEDDILMEEEVTKLAKLATKPSYMSISMVLSRQKGPVKKKRDFAIFNDRIASQHIIMSGIPSVYSPGIEVVCCGPPAFNDHVGSLFMKDCGYPQDKIHLM